MSDDCVLLTWCGTVLDVLQDGTYHHRVLVRRDPPKLRVSSEGVLSGFMFQNSDPHARQVESLKLDDCAILVEGKYVCAEPDGTCSRRGGISDWETFIMMPFEEALQAVGRVVPTLALKPRSQTIPRIIHQTSRESTVPESCRISVDALIDSNPGWTYKYWSDKDSHEFIFQYYGWDILETYLMISRRYGAARADLFRYLCVYQLGGVYLDIKSTVNVPLDKIIFNDDEYLLSQWFNQQGHHSGWGIHKDVEHIPGGEYQQWHIISAKGHPFLEAVIKQVIANIADYDEGIDGSGKIGVLRVTGPIAYSRAIYPLMHLHPHRLINAERAGLVYEAASRPKQHRHYSGLRGPIVS